MTFGQKIYSLMIKKLSKNGINSSAKIYNHGNFRFVEEETFIDEKEQKVLYRWLLKWPSFESGSKGRPEKRRGVDVIHFENGKIINKLTYSKTTIEIDGKRESLHL